MVVFAFQRTIIKGEAAPKGGKRCNVTASFFLLNLGLIFGLEYDFQDRPLKEQG